MSGGGGLCGRQPPRGFATSPCGTGVRQSKLRVASTASSAPEQAQGGLQPRPASAEGGHVPAARACRALFAAPRWAECEVDPHRGLHAVGSDFLAGGNGYRPTRSLQDFVRAQFRAESSEASEAVHSRLDTAFAALAALAENADRASALPRYLPPDAEHASALPRSSSNRSNRSNSSNSALFAASECTH